MLYAIIIYIIIMVIIIIIKPNFIYDRNKSKFKEFGSSKNKSFLSLGTTAIFLAILVAILFMVFGNSNDNEISEKEPKIQYISVPVYQQPQYIHTMQQQYPHIIYQQIPHSTQQIIPHSTQQIIPQIIQQPVNYSTSQPIIPKSNSPQSIQSTASPQYSEKN